MRLSIDSDFMNGPKNKKLSRLLKLHRMHTAGACLEVWSACYIARSPYLSADDVDNAAELDGFAEAMIAVGLAERVSAGHSCTVDLEFRDEVVPVTIVAEVDCLMVAGVVERIPFLLMQKVKSARGIEAKKHRARQRTAPPAEEPVGLPAGEPTGTNQPAGYPTGEPRGQPAGPPRGEPARVNPASSASASPSASPSPSDRISDSRALPRAPARDPAVVVVPAQGERAQIAKHAIERLNAMRAEIAEANGWTDVRPVHPLSPGITELRQRILESGSRAADDVEHVLGVLFAEARAKNTVRYLDASAFEPRSWARKLALRVEDAQATPLRAEGKRGHFAAADEAFDAMKQQEQSP